MDSKDLLHRFIFERSDIRGVIITLEESYQKIIAGRGYPQPIERILGEMLAVIGMLSTTLKFDGTITLQARSDGPLSLIMVDCTRHHNLRGLAQFNSDAVFEENACLLELMGKGHLTLTIDPTKGERYQGIVPMDSNALTQCIEEYFQRSEQLPTRLWLSANHQRVGGLLLQALPRQVETNRQENLQLWEHATQLAETLSAEEQLTLTHDEQLYRLFHQDELRLFDPVKLQFCCSCSRERTVEAIRAVGKAEVMKLHAETGEITMDCQFCGHCYQFSEADIKNIFDAPPPVLH